VRCTHANVQYVKDTREQLFAEAVQLLRNGFRWWAFPQDEAQAEQEQRYVEDSWLEPIVEWLDGKCKAVRYPDDMPTRPERVTTTQVMQHALLIEVSKHTRQDQMRVAQILRRLGWEKARHQQSATAGEGEGRVRPWLRPNAPAQQGPPNTPAMGPPPDSGVPF
jgi:predicted P-loop ATPase